MKRAETIAITLYPEDKEIVDAADTGDAGRSATIRKIIREWNAMRQRMLVDTKEVYRA